MSDKKLFPMRCILNQRKCLVVILLKSNLFYLVVDMAMWLKTELDLCLLVLVTFGWQCLKLEFVLEN